MVTVLDIGIVQMFDFIFPVILIWAFVFALLQKTKVIGDSPGINALIASIAALTVLLSRTVIDLINFMIPWFSIAIIFFVLMLLLFMIFGAKGTEAFYKDEKLRWVILGVGILIVVAAGGKVLGQTMLEAGRGGGETVVEDGSGATGEDFQTNIILTLMNPKILGLIIVFAIVIFAVALLSG